MIKLYGQLQITRKGGNLNHIEKNQVRAKLRFLGRLLHAVQEETAKDLCFADFYKPQYYNAFRDAVLKIRETNKQLALTLGHYIKRLCLLNKSEASKNGLKNVRQDSQDFLDIYNAEWTETVAASTLRLQQQQHLNKKIELPLAADIKQVTSYLEEQITSEEDYTRLQKLIMTSLILFNKRRPAEVANLKLDTYVLAKETAEEEHDEFMTELSMEEKILAKRYLTITIIKIHCKNIFFAA